MLVVRPAGPADLDHLLELAILSGPGFTSLPEDPDALAERLDLSQASFEGRVPWQEA
ncbi:arginine N-succinyltransferase subunit beta, partial [Streptomyces coelicoflavus ZG0656]